MTEPAAPSDTPNLMTLIDALERRCAELESQVSRLHPRDGLAECNLSQADYDNLVRDALKWRSSEEPLRLSLQGFCNAFNNNGKTSSLRDWNYRMKEAYDKAVLALGGYSAPLPTPQVVVDEIDSSIT